MHIAVIGAGWAGLSAAITALERGAVVTLHELSHTPGGRARTLGQDGARFDNGQHILIGAYRETLALMRRIGLDADERLSRRPMSLLTPDGRGLRLPAGVSPTLAFLTGVLRHSGWPLADRLALLRSAWRWRSGGFRCPPDWSVARLCADLPASVHSGLIDPLCVAALNTPSADASAAVFLRVLQDALFSGPGGADLLLPRVPLSALLPDPACRWLEDRGAVLHEGRRVRNLLAAGDRWQVDDGLHDAVVLATPAPEAARLTAAIAPAWSRQAAALPHLGIATVWLGQPGLRLHQPMLAMPPQAVGPAQFVFDLGQLEQAECGFAFVCSGLGAGDGTELHALTQQVLAQARIAFPGHFAAPDCVLHAAAERRATFACRPGLARPPLAIARHLVAAADYVDGPYPATLEGAVRSGRAAIDHLLPPPPGG